MADITIPDYAQGTDYTSILTDYLGNVRDDVDKREGSLIWDAGSPCCIEIAKAYVYLQVMMLNCFAATAEEPFMDYKAEEIGLERDGATYAYRLGVFKDGNEGPMQLALSTSFSTVDEADITNFIVDSVYTLEGATVPGSYILKCAKAGVIGNQYFGNITPVSPINGLASAELTDILIPGEDRQSTESLRTEYFSKMSTKAFSGNIAHYREEVLKIDGVGACQIYPRLVTDTNIVISILDSTYSKPSELLVNRVAEIMDPYYADADYRGKGLGVAPIDHYTTIKGAVDVTLDISCDITLKASYTIEQVTPLVESSIEALLLEIRKEWGVADELNNYALKIYIAKIQSSVLATTGVDNVANVKLNNATADITLTETKVTQQIPVKGTVTLNVV